MSGAQMTYTTENCCNFRGATGFHRYTLHTVYIVLTGEVYELQLNGSVAKMRPLLKGKKIILKQMADCETVIRFYGLKRSN